MVRRLEARQLEPLADPFGQLLEIERLVEHDPGAAVGIPAHLALDRTQALDDHDDLFADAIFLDRLDLHPAERDVVHVDIIVELADADRSLARDVEPRRTRAKTVARLAPGEKLAEVDSLVEFDADQIIAGPHHARRDFLRRQLDVDLIADRRSRRGDRHQAARREVLDFDQLLFALGVRELADAKLGRQPLVVPALDRARHRHRQRYGGRVECRIASAVSAGRPSSGSAMQTSSQRLHARATRAKMGLYGH